MADLTRTAGLLAPAWERAGLAVPAGDGIYGAAVLDPCPPSLYRGAPRSARRRVIRPSPGDGPPARTPAGGGVRAYVGFGTTPLFSDVPDLLHALVSALVDLGVDVTVTTAGEQLAADLRAVHPQRVRVERWTDLGALLPSCAVVVCHGGAGTVLAALGAGVPLLLVPRGAPSQIRMAAACEARGVGRSLAWPGADGGDLRTALSEVIRSESMAAAARAVAAEMAAMPPASTAVGLLRDVAGGWRPPRSES